MQLAGMEQLSGQIKTNQGETPETFHSNVLTPPNDLKPQLDENVSMEEKHDPPSTPLETDHGLECQGQNTEVGWTKPANLQTTTGDSTTCNNLPNNDISALASVQVQGQTPIQPHDQAIAASSTSSSPSTSQTQATSRPLPLSSSSPGGKCTFRRLLFE